MSNEIQIVKFHGDEIETFEHYDSRYVAMIDMDSQRKKLNNHLVNFGCGNIAATHSDGKTYQMLRMPVKKLPLWLACINPNKVAEAIRPQLELYQAGSAIALHAYWIKGAAINSRMGHSSSHFNSADMKAVCGMVKGILRKQLTDILPGMIEYALTAYQKSGGDSVRKI